MTVAPIPVSLPPMVALFRELTIPLVMFLQVTSVGPIFPVIPLVRVVMSPVFISFGILPPLSLVVPILRPGKDGQRQGRKQERC